MNENFTFFRFSKLLKSQFRLAATPLIVYVLATLTFYFLTVWLIGMPGKSKIWEPFWGFTVVIGSAGVLVVSSLICANIRKKIGFQTFNLLPASNLEKFLARVLICNVLPLIIWVVFSFLLYFNDDFVSKLGFQEKNLPVHIILTMCLVWLSSLSTFWAAVFRRFGLVVFLVFTTLLIVLCVNWLISANLMFLDPIARFIGGDLHRLYLVVGLFTGFLTIVNLTAAYFVYRRKEIRFKLFNW
ncbi:MAG: hypothetical protein II956_15470 [Bacteroidales bacterium]|nr:hypothetical protein [Bacteroidales bacterium]